MDLTLSPESLEPGASFQTPSPPPHPLPSLPLLPLPASPAAEEGAGGASIPPVYKPQVYQQEKPQTSPSRPQDAGDMGGGLWGH